MADQTSGRQSNRPPVAATTSSLGNAGLPPPPPNANSNNATLSPLSPSRQSSSASLAPYDERDLRDAEHTPRQSPRKEVPSGNTSYVAAASSAPLHSELHVPSMLSSTNANTANRHALKSQNRSQNDTKSLSPLLGIEFANPPPTTGHRRRRIVPAAKEHRSPQPQQYQQRHHPHQSNYSQTVQQHQSQLHQSHSRRRPIRSAASASPRPSAPLQPTSPSALPDTTNLRPVLKALCRALFLACLSKSKSSLRYCKSLTIKTFARKWVRYILYLLCGILLTFIALIGTAAHGFYTEATDLCTPPADHASKQNQQPPLIEYFVHGRGNGHYARSVAIVKKLNDAGIDVRMFIGRATMWRAVNEAHISSSSSGQHHGKDEKSDAFGTGQIDDNKKGGRSRRGVTTAISVTSITPSMDIFATLSHILERVTGDCEVARQTGRYPALVVTDGDIPGMLRSFFGSIPSVGISHGQTFAIGIKPDWVKANKRLNAAWEKQRSLNWRSAFLTNWQIGTSFAGMETNKPTGVIAMSPMRPEAVGMARERWRRHIGSQKDKEARTSNATDTVPAHNVATGAHQRFLTPAQRAKIDSLLLGGDARRKNAKHPRRKLVICYFRDKNGDVLQNALLRSGFDVLLFERGYHKGLMNIQGVEKFGHKWIVHRDEKRDKELAEMSLDEYWRTMLTGTNAKLLEDDEPRNATAAAILAGANANKEDTESSETSQPHEPRIIRVTDMSLFIPLLSIADGVASSAGSQLLSECIYSGTPILSLYRDNDDEQMLNIMIYRNMIANNKDNDRTGVGKVVHGISLEEFAEAFAFLATDDFQGAEGEQGNNADASTKAKGAAAKLLTKEQEFLLLRKPEARRAYDEFDQFVESIVRSKVSSTYYEELEQGDDPRDSSGWHDPFQGMPDAAPVMLEILKEVLGEE